MSALMVFKNNLLCRSCGRLAKGKGTRYEKNTGTTLYFYQVQDYQPPKKYKVELISHLQKLLNGLCCLNLFQF